MNIFQLCKTMTLSAILLLLVGCKTLVLPDQSSGEDLLTTGKTVYTLTNLHPDEKQMKLYSVNYQREGLIPACSKVSLESLQKKRLTFKVQSTGKTYILDKHSSSPDFPAYLGKYFGTTCVSSKIKALSATDRAGIEAGKVKKGMTKQGVIYAIGYPPEHRTPSTQNNTWLYWVNRFKTMSVEFDSSGRVSTIK